MEYKLSPTTSYTHHRTPSSPSLTHAIGLPPPLPQTSFMGPATTPRTVLKRSRGPTTPTHYGEVNSSDSEDDAPLRSVARVKGDKSQPCSPTPHRKIVNAMEAPLPRLAIKKKETLQDRLNAAAGNSPRKSSIPAPTPVSTGPRLSTTTIPSAEKVTVCVR